MPLLAWVAAALTLPTVYYATAYALQRKALFPSGLVADGERVPAPVGSEAWSLDTPVGPVEAWLLPPTVPVDGAAPVMLFAHGNAERIDLWPPAFEIPRAWGYAVLLVEYPGYGDSAGKPSQANIRETLRLAVERVESREDLDASRWVAIGRSLGGGAIGQLLRDRRPSATILMSTFRSVRAMASRYGLFGPLVRDPFDTEAVLRDYPNPVLVVHGRRDSLIPPSHAERLVDVAPRGRLLLYDADHNDCPPDWAAYWSEVSSFLQEAGLPGEPTPLDETPRADATVD